MWEGGSLWMLEAEHGSASTEAHAHHALQITFSIKGDFDIGTGDHWVTGPVVAVASDTRHIFRASGAAAHLFVESDGAIGRALSMRLFRESSIVALSDTTAAFALDALRESFGREDGEAALVGLGREIVERFAATVMPSAGDGRVDRMIRFAGENLDRSLSLPAAANHVCLSPSRASHLFVEGTGLAFKTYVLWLRLARAVRLYAGGSSLTEAAHEAGFADSAHFSRTFRRTFGVSAAALRLATD